MSRQALQADMSRLMQSYAGNEPERTLHLARRYARRYPDQPLPLNIMGAVQAKEGEHASAIKSFRKALAIEPKYPDALNNLCRSLRQLGQWEQAISSYRKLLTLRPGDSTAYFELAGTLMETGDFAAAAAAYERSIALKPDFAQAHYSMGYALDCAGKANEAVVSYRNAIEVDQGFVDAYLAIGQSMASQGKFDMAISWFRDALRIAPDVAQAHYRLGRALHLAGRRDEAIAAYRQCLDLDPAHVEAQHFLAAAGDRNTGQAPQAYIEGLFDAFAPQFERQLAGQLGYRAPEILSDMVTAFRRTETPVASGLDLGCGTGLSGEAFRTTCKTLVGIDLSEKMLAQARRKRIYDELLSGEVTEAIDRLSKTFDLFICADTVVYIGDLKALFSAVGRHARPGGLFALSTEHTEDGSFTLRPSGRFAHSRNYVESCAAQSGFKLRDFRTGELRQEFKQWLTGGFYLLEYAGEI
jgi:predicted TPR repeat methyltransferase